MWIISGSTPFSRSVARKNVPNSSDEARMLEVRLKVVFSSSPSYTPANIWLLPTSRVRSIINTLRKAQGFRVQGYVVDQAHTTKKSRNQPSSPALFDIVNYKPFRLKE